MKKPMLQLLYNAATLLAYGLLKPIRGERHVILKNFVSQKVLDFIDGRLRKSDYQNLREQTAGKRVVWFHCASLGEYAVARPLMKRLREEDGMFVVLTFFSSTGYNALHNKSADRNCADIILLLPIDTHHNARRFVSAVNPERAVFIISEIWVNHLAELRRRQIPTYLVSAIIRDSSVFFRWYGGLHRKALSTFRHITVLNDESRSNLQRLGYNDVTVCGDPLFDNALAIAGAEYHNDIIENFCQQAPGGVFIAGSIHDEQDLELVAAIANRHPEQRCIFVPHEISSKSLNRIRAVLQGRTLAYSECCMQTDLSQVQVLIIDFIGSLSRMYRFCRLAYVGGGFTPFLHSVIEATVYGLPVAFGPCIHRKVTPQQLMQHGIGQLVRTPDDLDEWYTSLVTADGTLKQMHDKALEYSSQNSGAVEAILKIIRS